MNLKKNIFLLIILSLVFILKGLDSQASVYYEMLLMKLNITYLQLGYFETAFSFSFAIGVLIGGFIVDKWNMKKMCVILIIILSSSSLILQFYNPYYMIVLHRFILGYSLGFFLISFKAFYTDLAIDKHRGKLLFILLNSSFIGSILFISLRSIIFSKTGDFDISYESYQIPFIILPLFIFFIVRQIPDNSTSNRSPSFKKSMPGH